MKKTVIAGLISSILTTPVVFANNDILTNRINISGAPLPKAITNKNALNSAQAMAQFKKSPRDFLTHYALNAFAINDDKALPTQGFARFKPNKYGFELEYTKQKANDTTNAYFLGYNGRGNPIAFVDIPKKVADGTALFTGSLSGCSVIVTELNDTHYRVFHDGRANSSILYDNVVMAVDHEDYQGEHPEDTLAVAYLQFSDGEWKMYIQEQKQHVVFEDRQTYRIKYGDADIPMIRTPHVQNKKIQHTKFETARESLQMKLLGFAVDFNLNIDHMIQDGQYQLGNNSIVTLNPAVSQWNRLRSQLTQAIDNDLQKISQDESLALSQLKKATGSNKALLEAKLLASKATKEYYFSKFQKIIARSQDYDQLWLWLQQKEFEGIDSVINTDINLRDSLRGKRLNDRYNATKILFQNVTGSRKEQYLAGLNNPESVEIPKLPSKFTTEALMLRFVNDDTLSFKQRGALTKIIKKQDAKETITSAFSHTLRIQESMKQAGATSIHHVPQDLILLGASGRCLPLARIMGTAFDLYGEQGAQDFVDSLFVMSAQPEARSSEKKLTSIIQLHTNVDAKAAQIPLGHKTLPQVVESLAQDELSATNGKFYLLNTKFHTMLVGKKLLSANNEKYYFYDPNFGIFEFANPQALETGLTTHLIKQKLASFYSAYTNNNDFEFDTFAINSQQMAKVTLATGDKVRTLINPEFEVQAQEINAVSHRMSAAVDDLSDDLKLKTSLTLIETANIAKSLLTASSELFSQHNLDDNWLPVFHNMTENEDGSVTIPLINTTDSEQINTITSTDERFIHFKEYLDHHFQTLNESYHYENGELNLHGGLTDVNHVDGLNAAFTVQTLIRWFEGHENNKNQQSNLSGSLKTALQIHTYLNLTQLAHGTVLDASKVTNLVRTALNSGESLTKNSISAISHSLNEGVGSLLGIIAVGLDSYELANATNEGQKAVFATQLAFDSTNVLVGVASISAGLVGASTTSAVLGSAGVILGGLTIGITALVQGFEDIAKGAQAVGHYFDVVNKSYKAGGYDYNPQLEALIPKPGAVVAEINFQTASVKLGSQYLYRTKPNSTGSGYSNYFVSLGYQPSIDFNKEHAINIREGLELPERIDMQHDASILVLPDTPQSYIRYKYQILPFATARHDAGFAQLRKLEEDKRFDFDYYSWPSEYIIHEMEQEFVHTNIDVRLDEKSRQLLMPTPHQAINNKLNYNLYGDGGSYHIGLRTGAKITLKQNDSSTWIFDTRQLNHDNVRFFNNHLTIGGVTIQLDDTNVGTLLLINKESEVFQLDTQSKDFFLVSENASHWQTEQTLVEHINKQASSGHLLGHFVEVENYHPNENEEHQVSKAYYDVEGKRFIYTDRPDDIFKGIQLVSLDNNQAYFTHPTEHTLWQTNASDGAVLKQYLAYENNKLAIKSSRTYKEQNNIYFEISYAQPGKADDVWTYKITNDSIKLVSITGDLALVKRAYKAALGGNASNVFIKPRAFDAPIGTLQPQQHVMAQVSDRLSLSVIDRHGQAHKYWLLTQANNTIIVQANLPDQNISKDLALVKTDKNSQGQPVYYFYSHSQNTLYFQQGMQSAKTVNIKQLKGIVSEDSTLFSLGNDGSIYLMDNQGIAQLAMVTPQWLTQHQGNIEKSLHKLVTNTTNKLEKIAILGLKDHTGRSFNAWFDPQTNRLVLASQNLSGKTLRLLSIDQQKNLAWIYNETDKSLFQQPLSDISIDQDFDQQFNLISDIESAQRFTDVKKPIVSAIKGSAGLQVVTDEGITLLLKEQPLVIGVTKQWYKNNHTRLANRFTNLKQRYALANAITLNGENNWYLPQQESVFSTQGISSSTTLAFLGLSADTEKRTTGFVFDQANNSVLSIDKKHKSNFFEHYSLAKVQYGNQLILQQNESMTNKSLSIPLIKNVDTLFLSGWGEKTKYKFNENMLSHYANIVIDDHSDRSVLNLDTDQYNTFVQLRENELLISSIKGYTMVITNLEQAIDNQLIINVGFAPSIELSTLVDRLSLKPNGTITPLTSLLN